MAVMFGVKRSRTTFTPLMVESQTGLISRAKYCQTQRQILNSGTLSNTPTMEARYLELGGSTRVGKPFSDPWRGDLIFQR